jgi:hypothetical protein
LYAYTFTLNGKSVQSITLPNNHTMVVLGFAKSKNPRQAAEPVGEFFVCRVAEPSKFVRLYKVIRLGLL